MKSHTSTLRGVALFSVLASFLFVSFVHAQEREAVTPAQAERAQMQEERRGALSSNAQNRMINLGQNVINRLKAAEARMEHIADRLDSRMIKLEDRGVDVDEARERLTEVRRVLEEAQTGISEMSSLMTTVQSDNPRTAYATLREEIRLIRDTLKEAQEGLRDTVALLKEAIRMAELERGVSDAVSEDPVVE